LSISPFNAWREKEEGGITIFASQRRRGGGGNCPTVSKGRDVHFPMKGKKGKERKGGANHIRSPERGTKKERKEKDHIQKRLSKITEGGGASRRGGGMLSDRQFLEDEGRAGSHRCAQREKKGGGGLSS